MVEAGAAALAEFDREYESLEDAAVRIYQTMAEAGHRQRSSG